MAENFANEYQTALNGAIDNDDTSLVVDSATGAPAPNFRIRIDDELMLVTNVASTTFTVTRGIEGTTAASHSDNAVVTHVLTAGALEAFVGAPAVPAPYVRIEDQKSQGTDGGTFTSGAWRTRDLNTEVTDTGGNASLSSNQITLTAGTYQCRITCPALYCDGHQARLQNITAGTTLILGTNEYSSNQETDVTQTRSIIAGVFTLSVTSVLEVQHRCAVTRNTSGFGVSLNWGTEVYTVVEFWSRDLQQNLHVLKFQSIY